MISSNVKMAIIGAGTWGKKSCSNLQCASVCRNGGHLTQICPRRRP